MYTTGENKDKIKLRNIGKLSAQCLSPQEQQPRLFGSSGTLTQLHVPLQTLLQVVSKPPMVQRKSNSNLKLQQQNIQTQPLTTPTSDHSQAYWQGLVLLFQITLGHSPPFFQERKVQLL